MMVPLGFVVAVSMIKDIFEDLKRHNSDNIENTRPVKIGNHETLRFESSIWMNVEVGKIVKIYEG